MKTIDETIDKLFEGAAGIWFTLPGTMNSLEVRDKFEEAQDGDQIMHGMNAYSGA